MGVRLPSEYQEVEWIGTTGTQYINTAHNPSGALKISMMFQSTKSPGDVFQSLCGVQNGGTKNYIRFSAIYTAAQTQVRFSSANGTNDSASNDFNIDLPSNNYINNNILEYMFDFGSGVFRVGEYSKTRRRNNVTLNIPLYLLARNNNGEATAFASGKLYSAEITDSGFSAKPIPCYRKSDNKPGMYDLVSDTFFTNAGTGEFVVGPDVIGKVDRALMLRRRGLMHNVSRYIYEASNLSFNGKSDCINTGVYLFTQENIDRDFEFIAEGIVGYGNIHSGESTIICAKYDTGALGFLVRPTGSTSLNYNGTIFVKRNTNSTVIVRRINGVITLSGTNITNPTVQFTNAVFNHPLVFGCALQNDGTPYRYCPGTIAHVTVRWL